MREPEYINIEVTWEGMTRSLVALATEATTAEARANGWNELHRMARIADRAVKIHPAAKALAAELNLWGDDTLETMNLTQVLADLNTALVDEPAPSPQPVEA